MTTVLTPTQGTIDGFSGDAQSRYRADLHSFVERSVTAGVRVNRTKITAGVRVNRADITAGVRVNRSDITGGVRVNRSDITNGVRVNRAHKPACGAQTQHTRPLLAA
jgi:hypothetical protein